MQQPSLSPKLCTPVLCVKVRLDSGYMSLARGFLADLFHHMTCFTARVLSAPLTLIAFAAESCLGS